MQSVSQEWKDNQKESIVSESEIRITIGSTDPDAIVDASASDNNSLYYAETDKVLDQENDTSPIYATMERNQWLLDGSRQIIPATNYEYNRYIGENISDDEGTFNENPIVTLSFSETHTDVIYGVTITWSTLLGEYAKEFIVTAYNGNDIVATKTVTDNVSVVSSVFMDIVDYDKITVEIVKWSMPYRRARIEKLLMGVELVFTKNDILSYSHSQRVHPLSTELPSSEISFSLDNSQDAFDFYNNTGWYKYIIERQEVKVEYGYKIGDELEWIDGGIFYLSEWNAPQNGLSADFKATDIFTFMTETYYKGMAFSGKTLYQLAEDVLNDVKFPLKWVIDETLKEITTTSPLPLDTQATCLQLIANAGGSVLYQDRQGVIHIKQIKYDENKTDYMIDLSNSYSKPDLIISKPVGKLICKKYNNVVEDVSGSNGKGKILFDGYILEDTKKGDSGEIFMDFGDMQYTLRKAETSSTDTQLVLYTNGCLIKYTRTSNDWIYAFFRALEIINPCPNDVTLFGETNGEIITVDNTLITDIDTARNVGEWATSYYDNRKTLSSSWRADPRLDALDVITNVDEYGENEVLITEVSYTYNGAFKGNCEGVVIGK